MIGQGHPNIIMIFILFIQGIKQYLQPKGKFGTVASNIIVHMSEKHFRPQTSTSPETTVLVRHMAHYMLWHCVMYNMYMYPVVLISLMTETSKGLRKYYYRPQSL